MKSYDFEFDGVRLSDKGFIICSFDELNVETISIGSYIEFNMIPTLNGTKHELINSTYEDCLTTTFCICKNICGNNDVYVSLEETRDIMRWLNRKNFHKFKLIDDEYSNIYFEASFNVSKMEINGRVCGFEIEMFTNRPFALMEPVILNIENEDVDGVISILSKSDEEGYISPDMSITINEDGDFKLTNNRDDRVMIIKNCKAGEVITIKYPVIESSYKDHDIYNDFNWKFFRISTTFKNRENELKISIPCSIKLKYNPIVKVGI